MPATPGRAEASCLDGSTGLRRGRLLAAALMVGLTGVAGSAQGHRAQSSQDPVPGQSSPRDLTVLLPADTLAVLDFVDGAACYQALLDFTQPWPESLPAFARLFASAFGFGVKAATGLFPSDLLEVTVPGQAAFAAIPSGGKVAAVFLSRVEDERAVERVLKRLLEKNPALQSHVGGGILTLASDRRALRSILDLRRDGGDRLAGRLDYLRHRAALRRGTALRLHLDLAGLRRVLPKAGGRGRLWQQADPGARLIFGPVAWALDSSARLDGALQLSSDSIAFEATLDGSALTGDSPAGLLLAGRGEPSSLPAAPPGMLATVRLDRSLRSYLRHVDRVLEEGDAAQVNAGLSTAGALIGGGSILDDLLPGIGEPWTVFVLGDDGPDAEDERPRIQLPSFVLVAPLRNGRAADLLVRFASTLSLINASERGQRGQRPFQVRHNKRDGARVMVARPPEWYGPGAPPTENGLSPTLWLTDGHAVVASTEGAARRTVESLQRPAERVVGDVLRLRGSVVADYLRRNRDVMATDEVLKKGGTLASARVGIDVLAAIAGALEALEIRMEPGADGTELRARLTRSGR